MTPDQFTTPSLDYWLFSPVLIVLGVACVAILVEAFVPRRARFTTQATLALLGLGAALAVTIWQWVKATDLGWVQTHIGGLVDPRADTVVSGTIMADGPTHGWWAILFGFTLIALIGFAERRLHGGATAFTPSAAVIPGSVAESEAAEAGVVHSEVFPLALFSVGGMAILVASQDLLVFFVGLEILSMPLYILAGLARQRRLASQEAALKYFLLGGAASAIVLFGVGCLFGYSGSFAYEALASTITFGFGGDPLLLAGMALVAVGLLFKIGAVPFHLWVPDVYQGSPTPVTAFMSVCTKVAAVAALLRLFYVGLGGMRWTWQPLLAGVAILTIVVGAVIAITQSDIKRILAYSSVAHAGFILVPVVGAFTLTSGMVAGQVGSVASVMFYLVAYGLATIGAFTIVSLVQSHGRESSGLASWAGLGRRHPVVGAMMTIFLLSLAGIPLTAGFVGKLAVFTAAWRGGYWWLVLVAIAGSLVAVYIYIRILQVMYFRTVEADCEPVAVVTPGLASWIVLAVCLIGTLGLAVVPAPLLDALQNASSFLIPNLPG